MESSNADAALISAQKSKRGCPHRKPRTMWKSILYSLEMAAPKPRPVLRNSARMKSLRKGTLNDLPSNDPQFNSQKLNASDDAPQDALSPHYDTQPVADLTRSRDQTASCNPSFSAFVSKAVDDQPTYTRFYSSLDESPEMEDPPDFVVPEGFGLEYHGCLTRADCEKALVHDGEYLVRRSSTRKDSDLLVLSLRFDSKLKHYLLFYDASAKTYSLGKKDRETFESLGDLVAKGLVTLYLDSRAAQFLQQQQLYSASDFQQPLEESEDKNNALLAAGGVEALGIQNSKIPTSDSQRPSNGVVYRKDSRLDKFLNQNGSHPSNVSESVPKDRIECCNCGSLIRKKFDTGISGNFPNKNSDQNNISQELPEVEGNLNLLCISCALKSKFNTTTGNENCSGVTTNCSNINTNKEDSQTTHLDISYTETPYYEVTRSLRRYNASCTSNKDTSCTLEAAARDVAADAACVTLLGAPDEVSINEISAKVEDLKEDAPAKDVHESKRGSKFWIFGSKKVVGSSETTASSNRPAGPDDITGIPHQFKVQSFQFAWCDICGHFLFGVWRQGVRCSSCKLAAHYNCSLDLPPDCTPQLAQLSGIFGKDLSSLLDVPPTIEDWEYEGDRPLPSLDTSMVPGVVVWCVEEVERRGLTAEGLYRVSGGLDCIEAARMAIEKGGGPEVLREAAMPDINAVAGVLKLFLRRLPLPLITARCFAALHAAYGAAEPPQQLRLLHAALLLLPPAHYHTLLLLLRHFSRITRLSAVNKMSARSLSVVFAPTLVEHDSDSALLNAAHPPAMQSLSTAVQNSSSSVQNPTYFRSISTPVSDGTNSGATRPHLLAFIDDEPTMVCEAIDSSSKDTEPIYSSSKDIDEIVSSLSVSSIRLQDTTCRNPASDSAAFSSDQMSSSLGTKSDTVLSSLYSPFPEPYGHLNDSDDYSSLSKTSHATSSSTVVFTSNSTSTSIFTSIPPSISTSVHSSISTVPTSIITSMSTSINTSVSTTASISRLLSTSSSSSDLLVNSTARIIEAITSEGAVADQREVTRPPESPGDATAPTKGISNKAYVSDAAWEKLGDSVVSGTTTVPTAGTSTHTAAGTNTLAVANTTFPSARIRSKSSNTPSTKGNLSIWHPTPAGEVQSVCPTPHLTPDHLLCMKFAALEPKVIEMLILNYEALFEGEEEGASEACES